MSNFKYTAMIIEPRRHRALHLVLKNALECLSQEWQIVVFHGLQNTKYVEDIVTPWETPRILLVQLPVENLTPKTYSALMTNPNGEIYKHIHTDYFLVFQTDSIMFKENAHLINRYIEQDIDYVGAPWLQCNYPPTMERHFIGNGGFSLRKRSSMLRIMEEDKWQESQELWQEDLFFTKSRPSYELKKPLYEDAMQFCVDEVFSPVTMACHQAWCHAHFVELARLYPICEELVALQSEEKE